MRHTHEGMWHLRGIFLLLLALIATQGAYAAPGKTPKPPNNAVELRDMPVEDAVKNLPVAFSGVVTCVDLAAGRLYLQDHTGPFTAGLSWSVATITEAVLPSIQPGDRVEVRGVTCSGMAAPFIAGSRERPLEIRLLARAPLPAPLKLGRSRKPTLQFHGYRAEITGYVQAVESTEDKAPLLKLLRGGETLDVILQGRKEPALSGTNLAGSDVVVTGVLTLVPDRESGLMQPRLIVPELSRLEILDSGLDNAFAQVPETINTARRLASEDGSRLCFHGSVLGCVPGRSLYLRVQKSGLRVRSPLISSLERGAVVDVAGFPFVRDGELFIDDAVVRARDAKDPAQPVALRFGEVPDAREDANLVRMSARLLNQLTRSADTVLLLEAGNLTFYARSLPDAVEENWPALEPGSLLELTGICDLSPESTSGGTFTLLLRNSEDIRLVQPPPFWTPQRLLPPALLVAFVIAATFAWIALLRRKVRAQTSLIVQKVERERVAEERDRIARELHDSLEQHLAGMAIQVDLASSRLRTSVERAGQSLEVVRALIRRGHEETRQAVWQLRSNAVTLGDLPAAIAEALEWHSTDLPVKISITGSPRPLPPTATHHLLRISQEAVGNAFKHAHPSRIQITIDYSETALTVEIQDNGSGFDPASVPENIPGHFGLAGMRERIQKLGGEFRIESFPGAGTTIIASVQWSRLATTEPLPLDA